MSGQHAQLGALAQSRVACRDTDGVSSLSGLQAALKAGQDSYYAFDLLFQKAEWIAGKRSDQSWPLRVSKRTERPSTTTSRSSHQIFQIWRDDFDWRFVVSGTDLTTDREARELNITVPSLMKNSAVQYQNEASTWMITGECVVTQSPSR